MNGFLAICLLATLAVTNANYDVSGCEKFITALISSTCKYCPKQDECSQCVTDGLNGGDVKPCKSYVPDKFDKCFELSPLLQKIKVTDIGVEINRCMDVDVCAKLGEYAEQVSEYVDQAAKQAQEAQGNTNISDECKSEAGEHAERAQKASEKLQKMAQNMASKNGPKMLAAATDALKELFGLDDQNIEDMTTCGTSVCSG